MTTTLRYGRGLLTLEWPNENCRAIVQPSLPPPIADADEAITRCLDDPVGTKPLSELVEGRRRVVVVIPDMTRGEGVQAYLPPLLGYIERHHVRREHVTILTATGAHRCHSDAEREALVGAQIARNWRVEDHDPDDGNDPVEPLDEATPLWIDRRAIKADCLIVAGPISFHYSAGFGGGRKLIAPGLCSRATVHALHRRTLANIDTAGRWQGHTGALRHNPFHEALQAAAERVKPHFSLNVSMDGQKRILSVVSGDCVRSHLVACLQYAKIYTIPIPERLPLVIASCGGYPYDINLYQAHKALDNAFRAVQPGGTIVLFAECAEGWGSESFAKWMTVESLEEHRARLASGFEVAGHTTYAFKWKASQCRIILVSETLERLASATPAPLSSARVEVVRDGKEALALIAASRTLSYYVMPVASCSLPEVTS